MLLELLSDFQISIPELGRIEATTQPVVLLTSNNTRELTEALKRRCLYLWLDYPNLEHELEIVRLHSPELDRAIARKLVEIVHEVRELDLKKPPSIAESIDWARALLLLGADDIDDDHLPRDDERDRQAPHRPRHGRRAGRRQARPADARARGLTTAARRLRRDPAAGSRRLRRPAAGVRRGSARGGRRGRHLRDARRVRGARRRSPGPRSRDFKEALAATLAKSPEDRRVFDLVFERFFFRAAEAAGVAPGRHRGPGHEAATRRGSGRGRDRPRHAAPADRRGAARRRRGRAARPGAAGDRRLRPRRGLGRARRRRAADPPRARACAPSPSPTCPRTIPRHDGLPRDQLRRFEQHLRRELERDLIERTATLPPKRPLNELDRALPTGPIQDLAAVHRVVAQLKRRLATQGHELRGRKRHAHVDVRRTMRASLQTGGVPIELKYRPQRPRRPEIFVLCDVSTSVTSASTFFLSVLHALHDAFRKLRSFVFIERISRGHRGVRARARLPRRARGGLADAGVADISGYTDYGRVWTEFLALIEDELHPRATVIVLGDARTNGRPPRDDVFAAITAKAGRTFWLNPEPRLYWNYGDSRDRRLRAVLHGVRVLAHRPARGVRQGADAADHPVAVRRVRAGDSITAVSENPGGLAGKPAEIAPHASERPGADPSNLWGNARGGSNKRMIEAPVKEPRDLQGPDGVSGRGREPHVPHQAGRGRPRSTACRCAPARARSSPWSGPAAAARRRCSS